jgi:predicted small lipoprotein YifL
MNRTVRHLSYLLALFLLASCLPKRALYFFPASPYVSHNQQQQALRPVVTRHPDAPLLPAERVQPDSLLFTAVTNPKGLAPPKFKRELSAARQGEVQPTPEQGASVGKQQARFVGLQKAVAKKVSKKVQGKRPIHRSAWLSALFTVAGLVLFAVATTGLAFSFGVYIGPYLPLYLLAFGFLCFVAAAIIGITGILKINKTPGRFSGAGLARVSAAASLCMVALLLYNLLLLLLFSLA